MLSISVCSCGGLAGNAVTVRWFQKRRARIRGHVCDVVRWRRAHGAGYIFLLYLLWLANGDALTGWSVAMIIFVLVGLLLGGVQHRQTLTTLMNLIRKRISLGRSADR